MSDSIDREDLIDWLTSRIELLEGVYGDLGGALSGVRKMVKAMPSAEPEQKWIPVTEALPEECVNVLIQMDDGEMAVSQRRGMNYWDGYRRRGDIVAWMPLPEVYRGE